MAYKTHHMSDHSEEFRQKAQALKQDVQDLGRLTKTVAQESYENLRHQVGDALEQGKERAQNWEKSLEEQIKNNPVKAVMIAAGVGLLLGALWKSR